MKKTLVGLSAGLLTLSAFSCDWGNSINKNSTVEERTAEVAGKVKYELVGSKGRVSYGFSKSDFTKETRDNLDPKNIGKDVVLETSIWLSGTHDEVKYRLEKCGIPTYDEVRNTNWFKDYHMKFNMKYVIDMKRI